MRAPRILSWLAITLLVSCSGDDAVDLPKAERSLDRFLEAPEPGETFESFLSEWRQHARLSHLQNSLDERRTQGHAETAPATAALLMTETLLRLEEGDKAAAQNAFAALAESEGWPTLLSIVEQRSNRSPVPRLLDTIEEAYFSGLERRVAADNPPDSFRSERPEMAAVLEAIAAAPACLWPLYEELRQRRWAGPLYSDTLLEPLFDWKIGEREEFVAEFLLHAPLTSGVPRFDPLVLPLDPDDTLLETLLRRFADRGPSPGKNLARILRRRAPDRFGARLISLHAEQPGAAAAATARLFQNHLGELRAISSSTSGGSGRTPEEQDRERECAELAFRLTRGLHGDDLLRDGPLELFHEWLEVHELAHPLPAPGPATVTDHEAPVPESLRPWLEAERLEDLPVQRYALTETLMPMLDDLVARDPAMARRLLLHVDRLSRAAKRPNDGFARHSSPAITAMDEFMRKRHTPEARALFVNTFVEARGQMDWTPVTTLLYGCRSELLEILYARKLLETRYNLFFEHLRVFVDLCEFEDTRILMCVLRDVSNHIPLNDVKIPTFLKRIGEEMATIPDDADEADLRWRRTLHRLRDALALRGRALGMQPPKASDPPEEPWLAAIRDEGQDWSWRFAIASTLLDPDYGEMSNAFVYEAIELLIEGYQRDLPFHLEGESHVIGAAQQVLSAAAPVGVEGIDPDPRAIDLRRQLLKGWWQRIGRETRFFVQPETVIRVLRLAVEFGDPAGVQRILKFTNDYGQKPSSWMAALGGGDPVLAAELMAENHEAYRDPPRYQYRDAASDTHFEAFISALRALPPHHGGLAAHDREHIVLHARALYHVTPTHPRTGKPTAAKDAIPVARALATAYHENDNPGSPIRQALMLLAGDDRLGSTLAESLDRWSFLLDEEELFYGEAPEAEAEVTTLLRYFRLCVAGVPGTDRDAPLHFLAMVRKSPEARLGATLRNRLFTGLAEAVRHRYRIAVMGDAELNEDQHDYWIRLLHSLCETPHSLWNDRARGFEYPLLVNACAVASRCEDLHSWWQELAPELREFHLAEATEGIGNVYHESARFARDSKRLPSGSDARRQFAANILKAPVPGPGTDFTGDWIYREMATASELLAWAPTLIEAAPRRGCTAFHLAKMTRTRLRAPLRALELIEMALAADGRYASDTHAFSIERARILQALGRKAEALNFLESYRASLDADSRFLKAVDTELERISGQGADQ